MKLRTGLALAAIAAAALAPLSTTEAEPQYVFNFGTAAPEGTPWATQLNDIKTRVEAETNGAVQLKMFLGGTMGGEIEVVRDVRRGERLQGAGVSTAALAQAAKIPLLEMPELPYLFQTVEEADAVLDEVLLEPITSELESKGFTLLALAENGWRCFATKGGPATSIEQLKQYKMRSQESPVHINMYSALGVQYETKAVTEVLPSLQTGVVTGFDNTPLFSLAAGWTEPITHYNLSRHIYQPAAVVYSSRYIESKGIPDDIMAILIGDRAAEAQRGRQGVRALEAELLETIGAMGKEVVDLTDAQRQSFAAATQSVHTQFLADNPDLQDEYDAVQAKLASMR